MIEDDDEILLAKAIELVKKNRTVSASWLQRKMRLGYPKAAYLIAWSRWAWWGRCRKLAARVMGGTFRKGQWNWSCRKCVMNIAYHSPFSGGLA